MNGRYLIQTAIIGTAFLFVGCSVKTPPPSTKIYDKDGGYSMAIYAKAPSPGFLDSKATHLNNVIVHTLQIAAEETKADNKSYFAIVYPNEISVLQGNITNTTDEYIKKCAVNDPITGLLLLQDPCKIAKGSLNYPTGGEMLIVPMENKSPRFVVYDANEVLNTLKSKEMLKQ